LKPTFERSSYLDLIENKKHRRIIAKMRLSSHKLLIETGRHHNIDRNERICPLCNCNDIEDEYHFILICPQYLEERIKYIPEFYYKRPSMFKFIKLLNSSKKTTLRKLAIYCISCFKKRDNTLFIITWLLRRTIAYTNNWVYFACYMLFVNHGCIKCSNAYICIPCHFITCN